MRKRKNLYKWEVESCQELQRFVCQLPVVGDGLCRKDPVKLIVEEEKIEEKEQEVEEIIEKLVATQVIEMVDENDVFVNEEVKELPVEQEVVKELPEEVSQIIKELKKEVEEVKEIVEEV